MSRERENPGRREYLKTVGGAAVGLAVGGAAAWLAKPEVTAPGVTRTQTVTAPGGTVTKTVTTTGVTTGVEGPWWDQYMPRADRLLQPYVLEMGGLGEGDRYLYPNDWAKSLDWDAIRSRTEGKTMRMVVEGVDTSAFDLFKPGFQGVTGATLELVGIPGEVFHEKVMSEFVAGTGRYDAGEFFLGNISAYKPYMINMREYADQFGIDLDSLHPLHRQFITGDNNELFGFPGDPDLMMFVMRSNLLERIGEEIPWDPTWEEIMTICEKLKPIADREGWYPFDVYISAKGFMGFGYWETLALQWKDVTLIVPDTWEPNFIGDEGGGVEALELYKKQLEYSPPGNINFTYPDSKAMWVSGKVAMLACHTCLGRQAYGEATQDTTRISPINTDNRIAILPFPRGTTRRAPGNWYSGFLGLANTSKNPELAFLYAVYMASQESSCMMAARGTGVECGHTEVIRDKTVWKMQPSYEVEWKTMHTAYNEPWAWIPEEAEIVVAAGAEIYRFLDGSESSARRALEAAEEVTRRILEKGGYYKAGAPAPPTCGLEEWCKERGITLPKP